MLSYGRKSAQNRFAKTPGGRCAAVKVRKMGLVLGAYIFHRGHSIASAVCAADAWVARAAANAKFEGNGIIDATTPTRVKVAKRDKR